MERLRFTQTCTPARFAGVSSNNDRFPKGSLMSMMASELADRNVSAVSETAWMLGQPGLDDYLEFVRSQAIGGRQIDEWRVANDHFYDLEQKEAGIADKIETFDLDASLAPLAAEITADQRFQHAFDTVPARIEIVELDRLIVSQLHIDITHSSRIGARLGAGADAAALLRFCQPLDRAEAPFTVRRTGKNRYTFWSPSSDFRFHEATLLDSGLLPRDGTIRPNSGILGLMVGYSSNFLSAIRSDNRLLIHNGHHRAYALRSLGYTHAPCIVQTVTRLDELGLVASHNVVESPALYFKSARPPLLKDFFNPKFRKVFQLPAIRRMVELSFEVREYEVAD
jgi:hypothetical protein